MSKPPESPSNYASVAALKAKQHALYQQRVKEVASGIRPGTPLQANSMFPSVNKPPAEHPIILPD